LSGESSALQCGQQKQWRVSEIGKFKILLRGKSKFIFNVWIRYCLCSWQPCRQHWWCWKCKCTDDDKAIDFCQSVGLLPKQAKCPNCGDIPSKVYKISRSGRKRQQFRFQCNKQKCKRKTIRIMLLYVKRHCLKIQTFLWGKVYYLYRILYKRFRTI
jgi:hypothetical protein